MQSHIPCKGLVHADGARAAAELAATQEDSPQQMRLGSSGLVHGPGLFQWCQTAYRTGDAAVAVRVLSQTYDIGDDLAEALLCGRIPVIVKDDAVHFAVPQGECDARFYLLVMHGDVEPELRGPFEQAHLRDDAAREHRCGDPAMCDGLYRLDVLESGVPVVQAYEGSELEAVEV